MACRHQWAPEVANLISAGIKQPGDASGIGDHQGLDLWATELIDQGTKDVVTATNGDTGVPGLNMVGYSPKQQLVGGTLTPCAQHAAGEICQLKGHAAHQFRIRGDHHRIT